MENLNQKIREQAEKLKYLESKRENNLEILNNRIREINKEKKLRGIDEARTIKLT